MPLQIKFFASLRDELGTEQIQAEFEPGTSSMSVAQLLELLARHLGSAVQALDADGVRIAVNQTLLPLADTHTRRLNDGDEVAFLPPVTGG